MVICNLNFRNIHLITIFFIVLNQGGALYCNFAVLNLFHKYKYEVFPTGDDASFQIFPVEQGHWTSATSVWALLFGASIDIKI